MSISSGDIAHLANLAKVNLSPEEIELYSGQLAKITDYMGCLAEVDTAAIPPAFHALENTGVMRADEVKPSLSIEEVLANAPAHDGRSFIVPKIL